MNRLPFNQIQILFFYLRRFYLRSDIRYPWEHTKKMMSCDFSKLPKEKNDDSDNIMDDKHEAQDDENEMNFAEMEMSERKTRVERSKSGRLKFELKNKLWRI